MSSFPYRNPTIFDWHPLSELTHVWEDSQSILSADLPRPVAKTGYPTAPFFPAPAPPSAHPFPYAAAQFSPTINYTYDNGAEAPLGADGDMMLVVEESPRQELPEPSSAPQVKPAPLPVVEMTDAATQATQTLLLKEEGHKFRSKRPVPPSAEDHPTSAIGDDDADYMDEEPSSQYVFKFC